ncbi:MAG: hypothetical protein FWG90_09145 [Oscillospiraceae bacterium]|nr:hypothetical protein [Oscillospiraceae bacterium]
METSAGREYVRPVSTENCLDYALGLGGRIEKAEPTYSDEDAEMDAYFASIDSWPDDSHLFYSESNMRAIDEAIKRMAEGRVVIKTMEELRAMENG